MPRILTGTLGSILVFFRTTKQTWCRRYVEQKRMYMLTEPMRVRPGEKGRLIVQIPYSPDHVATIKAVGASRVPPMTCNL